MLKVIRLFSFIFLLLCSNLYAENVVYIDIDYIINNSLVGKNLSAKLQENFKNKDVIFKKKENELKKKENQLFAQKNILDENAYEKKVDKLKKEIEIYKSNKAQFIKKFNSKKIEYTKLLLQEINPILEDFSKQKSIGIILQKKNIVIGKSNLDITKDIITILNNKIKKLEIN